MPLHYICSCTNLDISDFVLFLYRYIKFTVTVVSTEKRSWFESPMAHGHLQSLNVLPLSVCSYASLYLKCETLGLKLYLKEHKFMLRAEIKSDLLYVCTLVQKRVTLHGCCGSAYDIIKRFRIK